MNTPPQSKWFRDAPVYKLLRACPTQGNGVVIRKGVTGKS